MKNGYLNSLISERRRERRCEASRRSTQRASFYSHMGKQNNRESLILAMSFIQQKVIIFRGSTDIRDEPARPWRSLTAYFPNVLKDTNLKYSHNIDIGLIIAVSKFHSNFSISFESIVFFAKTELSFLHTFFAYNSSITKYVENLIISRERTFEDLSKSLKVLFLKQDL